MVTLVNRAKVATVTSGTGTITLGAAEDGYQTFADAGVTDGAVVRYAIEDGTNFELGTGTYTASGTTLSRTPTESSNSDAAINLSGTAVVYVTATAADFLPPAANVSLDDTNLVVAESTNMQTFADKTDDALLKARGTGFTTTYDSSATIGGTTFSQPAVKGEIASDLGYFAIDYAGATGITVATGAASVYVYIDSSSNLQQQTTLPTRQDWTRKMFTMRISVNTVAGTILGFEYLANPIGHYANSTRDLYEFLVAAGLSLRTGQEVTGRTDNLGFDVAAGSGFRYGGTGDIYNPNIKGFDAVSNATYDLLERVDIAAENQTNLSKNWDNAGTITPLGSTTLVGHRVYRFSNGQFAMQYGQGNYANMTLAKAGVALEEYVLNPRLLNATLFGWWIIESTATVTSGTPTLTFFKKYTIGVS